jgi:hypothetical protein
MNMLMTGWVKSIEAGSSTYSWQILFYAAFPFKPISYYSWLLAEKETVLQGMIDRLTEIGRCYGMEMNVGKD